MQWIGRDYTSDMWSCCLCTYCFETQEWAWQIWRMITLHRSMSWRNSSAPSMRHLSTNCQGMAWCVYASVLACKFGARVCVCVCACVCDQCCPHCHINSTLPPFFRLWLTSAYQWWTPWQPPCRGADSAVVRHSNHRLWAPWREIGGHRRSQRNTPLSMSQHRRWG